MEAMLEKFFRNSTESISVQAFRYVLAGTLAYIVDFVMLIIYVEGLKLHYLTAAAIAFLCGAATSYALNIRWVFNKRTFRNVIAEVSIFLSIVIAGLVLNHLCIRFLTCSAGLHYTFSKVISTVIVAAVNFSTRKYILFR